MFLSYKTYDLVERRLRIKVNVYYEMVINIRKTLNTKGGQRVQEAEVEGVAVFCCLVKKSSLIRWHLSSNLKERRRWALLGISRMVLRENFSSPNLLDWVIEWMIHFPKVSSRRIHFMTWKVIKTRLMNNWLNNPLANLI